MEVESVSFPRNIEDEAGKVVVKVFERKRERRRRGRGGERRKRNKPFSCPTYIKDILRELFPKVCMYLNICIL